MWIIFDRLNGYAAIGEPASLLVINERCQQMNREIGSARYGIARAS